LVYSYSVIRPEESQTPEFQVMIKYFGQKYKLTWILFKFYALNVVIFPMKLKIVLNINIFKSIVSKLEITVS